MNGIWQKSWVISILIILSYLLLWVIVLQFAGMQTFLEGFRYYLWQVLYIGALGFTLYHWVPSFLRKHRHLLIRIIVWSTIFLLLTAGYLSWIWLGGETGILPIHTGDHLLTADFISRTLVFELFTLAYFAAIRHYIDSMQLRLAHKQLQIDKKISELNYLKAQTNPHFLFNTLNNIYALSRNKSDKAPESLLRLSTLLRYMLYETSAHRIPIERELSIIDDYLQLEKLRYDGSLDLVFSRKIENSHVLIPPLILLPLVENAFKHGAAETQHHPYVHINLTVEGHELFFFVTNSYAPVEESTSEPRGIGLRNLEQQLRLLYTDYSLELKPQPESFSAALTINLASHASL